MFKVILDQTHMLLVGIILKIMLDRTTGQGVSCKPNHYITDVDRTTCRSCQEDGGARNKDECSFGKIRVDIRPCDTCCAKCQSCETCGLGRYLYHDFEGRACSWNSNVVCCEERNMEVVSDVCVHRTTTVKTTTVKTTTVTTPKDVVLLTSNKWTPLNPQHFRSCTSEVKQCTALLMSTAFALMLFSI